MCEGKDRFRFDNKEGRGTWICNQCGAGDGFKLLEMFKGWTFRQAACEVEQIVGTAQATSIPTETDEAKKMAAVKRVWGEAVRIGKGDPAWRYLNRRTGIEISPSCLRYHPALAYVEGDTVEYHPALVAAVTAIDGTGVGVHRIYLTSDGEKAPVRVGKKLMTGKPLQGASIKLSRHSGCVGIAEGIETALAASVRFSVPVWAAVSAGLLEQWMPPEGIDRVIVFGDNDKSYTGQAAAFGLAKKLTAKGINVDVRIPEAVGTDWASE